MSEPRDMDAPVTRRELHDVVGEMAGLIKGWLETLETRLRTDIQNTMREQEGRLMREVQRCTKASELELISRLTVADDQYRDLVGRVVKLETKVFAPPKRKRRAVR